VGLPRTPTLDHVLDRSGDVRGACRLRVGRLDRRPAQGEAEPLTSLDREPSPEDAVQGAQLDARSQPEPVGTAPAGRPALDEAEKGPAEPVLGPPSQLELEFDATAEPLHQPQQFVRRVQTESVAALATLESQRVDEPGRAVRRLERRVENERAFQVAQPRLVPGARADRPVAGIRIQDAREHGRAVVARQAEPFHRPVASDGRSCVAVREKSVIANAKGHDRDPYRTAPQVRVFRACASWGISHL
jgi:hypothetical protein